MKKIIIAGGTGFLGNLLEPYFLDAGYEVYILSRHPRKDHHVQWDGKTTGPWQSVFEGADVVINLSGKSVDCRYTAQNREAIYHSRIDPTRLIGHTIAKAAQPPKLWINASSATIYIHAENLFMSEKKGIVGDDFSMNICKSWEKSFFQSHTPHTRKIAIRTSLVLGHSGGVLSKLKTMVRFGFGGKHGTGGQKLSWISDQDFCRSIQFLIQDEDLSGAVNITAPEPTTDEEFMATLRKRMRLPFGIAKPRWLLELGAHLIATETELILKSRNVIPQKLIEKNFTFLHPNHHELVKYLFSDKSRPAFANYEPVFPFIRISNK